MPVKPLRPEDVVGAKAIIEAFNDLIAKHFSEGVACFRQDEVVDSISAKGIPEDEIYANHWLDVEDIYQKEGWGVTYDKPAYNESYAATFTFAVNGKRC